MENLNIGLVLTIDYCMTIESITTLFVKHITTTSVGTAVSPFRCMKKHYNLKIFTT